MSWLTTSSDGTFKDYLAVRPDRSLAALVARDPDAFEELAGWVHSFAKQLGELGRRGGGFPWAYRP